MPSTPSAVTVYYPFHPLVNHTLEVITWPRKPTNAVTVRHPDGNTVKIPLWMLQPDAASFRLCEQIVLCAGALSALVDLLLLHASSMVKAQSHQEQTHEATPVRARERQEPPLSAQWHSLKKKGHSLKGVQLNAQETQVLSVKQ